MLDTLRKQAKKSNMWRCLFSVIGAVILLVCTKFAIFDVITGPSKLDITSDPESYDGKYVTIDADFLLYDYIEHTTTTKRKYSSSTSTRVDGYSYIAFQSIDDYENQTSIWYFYSIYMNKDKQSEMSSKIDQTLEYLIDETGNVAPPNPVSVTGTWTKMEPQIERYFRDSMAEMEITESDFDRFYFYELDTEHIGGVNTLLFWVLTATAAALFVYAIISAIGIFNNAYMKPIQQFLQQNSSVSLSSIEADFNQAHLIQNHVWIGKNWTVYMAGNKAKIFTNKDLTWGYYFCRTGRNSVSEMRLYTKEKNNMISIGLTEQSTKEALKIYGEELPWIIVGYDDQLEKLYNRDFPAFLELKYNPAMKEL